MPARFAFPLVLLLSLAAGCGSETAPDTTRNLAIQDGNNQTAPAGQPVATAPSVKVTNGSGAGVSGVAVTFAVASGGGAVSGGTQTTDGSGVARVGSWTMGQTVGSNTLTAQVTGGASVTISATATAGSPAAVTKQGGDNQSANTRAAVAVRPAIRVVDQFGNPVPGAAAMFSVTGGGGSVTGPAQTTGADGVATVGGWTLGSSPGANQLTATVAGGGVTGNPVVFSAQGQEVVIQPAQDTALQGTVRVNRLVIAAGRTVTVSNGVTIDADSTVVIAGTLRGDCVAITIRGEQSVAISGTLDNVCSDPPAGARPGLTVIAKGGYDLSTATVRTTGDVDISNDPTLVDGDFLRAPGSSAAPAAPARLAANVICGVNSLSAPQATNGKDGTDGTNGANGQTWTLRCRGDLSIGGTVAGQDGGDGGNGLDDQAGAANSTGGSGGDGGKLVVKATGIVALGPGAILRSGRGGHGGSATAIAKQSNTGATAPSATAKGGNGGTPGLIEVRGKAGIQVSGSARFQLGDGGNGGDATASGADGFDATATDDAQHGGPGTATGGIGGSLDSDKLRSFGNVLGAPPVIGGDGGAGGDATASGGKGGNSQIETRPNGGNGGKFTGTGGDGGNAEARNLQGARFGDGGDGGHVSLSRGNGGTGWDDCGSTKKQGGRGGDGGSADGGDGKGGTGASSGQDGGISIADAGNGGQGGDGEPVGTGGDQGSEAALQVRKGPPVKTGQTFQPGAPGNICGIPVGKGAVQIKTAGVPANPPAILGVIKQGQTTVAQVTGNDQVLVLDPGSYVFEAVTIDPTGYNYQPGACVVLAALTGAPRPRPSVQLDDQPCPFTVQAQQLIQLTRAWVALNALVLSNVTGLPLGTSVQLTYLRCLQTSPCAGPSIVSALGQLYLVAGLYTILGPDASVRVLREIQRFRPLTQQLQVALVAGAIQEVLFAYALFETSLFYQIASTIKADPRVHAPHINLWLLATLILTRKAVPLAAPEAGAAATRAGEVEVTITGPAPFVTVTGTLATDGTIVATGVGTVAGFPNVPVSFTGKINPDGSLSGDYKMGQDVAPTGLPNGSITYSLSGPQIDPPAGAPRP